MNNDKLIEELGIKHVTWAEGCSPVCPACAVEKAIPFIRAEAVKEGRRQVASLVLIACPKLEKCPVRESLEKELEEGKDG